MAADQITFTTSKRTTDESSSVVIVARFRNRSSAADVTPTNIKYRLDCLATGTQLLDWTSATASTSATVTVTSTQNKIQNGANQAERKRLTMASDYGLSTEYREHFDWQTMRRI